MWSSKKFYYIGFIVILCYYIPFLIMGENSYLIIHDHLEPYLAHYKMLKEYDAIFDSTKSIPVMSGLEKGCFDLSNLITTFFYTFTPAFWSIIINNFLVRIIAFIGMFELLRKHIIIPSNKSNLISFICSLCFAFIPFYSLYGISSAGIPLLLYSFYNLYKKEKIYISLFLILIYCIYSNFVLSGIFIGFVLLVIFIYLWVKNKRINLAFFEGLIVMAIVYGLTNYKLFESFFIMPDCISHRVEFKTVDNIPNILKQFVIMVTISQYHAGLIFTFPTLFLSLFVLYVRKKWNPQITNLLFVVAIILGFWFCLKVAKLYITFPSFIDQFQIDRFYFLLPTIWILILALSVELIFEKKYYWIIVLTLLCTIGGDFALNKECTFYAKKIVFHKQKEPTYKQFIDTKLFQKIDNYIGKDKSSYKIVSIGMYPAPAQYNDFYCIDGYGNNYPLEYKHQFRKIISSELNKSNKWENYFDNWGSRCFIFSSELSHFCCGKDCNISIHNLNLDIQQLKSMNCQYIFSAVPILNYQDLELHFEKSFTTDESFWKIYLYSL